MNKIFTIIFCSIFVNSKGQIGNFPANVIQAIENGETSENQQEEIHFYLANKDNRLTELSDNNHHIVDPKLPLIFLIHGWGESHHTKYYKNFTVAYSEIGNCNIVQLDWSKPAANDYFTSARLTRNVGSQLGKLIVALEERVNIQFSKVHVLGHSLGAQVAGFAGKEVIAQTGRKIRRITGLDPAGPGFDSVFKSKPARISAEDAEIVDVIHTDGGRYGMVTPVGTIDFYPNGGLAKYTQPQCQNAAEIGTTILNILTDLRANKLEDILRTVFCNHEKSWKYFIQSIATSKFVGTQCSDYESYLRGVCNGNPTAIFGEHVSPKSKGVYYLQIS